MAVISANLRIATPEESAYAHGNFFYRSISSPIWRYLQGCGAKELSADKSNYFLNGKPPLLLRTWNVVKTIFGYKDNILTRYPCTGLDRVDTNEKTIIKAILKHSRNGEVFLPSKGMKAFEIFLQACFPSLTSNDLILSCEKNQTKVVHRILGHILQPKCIERYLPKIREECLNSFHKVKEGEKINATEMVRHYFIRNFGQNIFSNSESGIRLNDHLNTFKKLIFRQACNLSTPDDANIKQTLVRDIRQTTSEILNENPHLFASEEFLSNDAKCALIFLLLFAAQDNTTTALSAALWSLAAHPEKGEELREVCQEYQKNPNGTYPEQLNQFFSETLQEYSPVTGVSRIAAQDLCLEFIFDEDALDSDFLVHKTIIFKDELVVARIDKLGKKNLLDLLSFGYGLHKCPGMHYAQAAVKEFIIYTLANYQIKLAGPKEFKLKHAFTALLENDVEVFFIKNSC